MALSSFTHNSQWDVEKVTIEKTVRYIYFGETNELDFLRYTIHMKRRPEFFVYTLVIPCILLTGKYFIVYNH